MRFKEYKKIILSNIKLIYVGLIALFVLFFGISAIVILPKDIRQGIQPAITELRAEVQKMNNRLENYHTHKHNRFTGVLYYPTTK